MDALIYLSMDNAKIIINVLKAVQFRDLATVFATANGLKVTVEDAKCIQGNAFLHAELFREYKLSKDVISFKTNINVLIDCLSIFGITSQTSSTSLVLTYKEYGSTLDLLLEENGVVAECNIKTMEAFEVLDFDFSGSSSADKIIVKSECMREAFSELDMSSEILELTLIPPPAAQPRLRFTTYGLAGTMHFDLPRSSDQVEVFELRSATPRVARYRLSLLRPATNRALSMATGISLRVNERGFLSMQHMINLVDGQAAFVEFFCVPDEDDGEQSGDEGTLSRTAQPPDVQSGSLASVPMSNVERQKRTQTVWDPDWSD
ncbi:Cell cycle checkpoint protein RAD1 [Paragonimus heterotremus]|uniref:Cell cycle checkpoint protein RAD1 n=1 Tax=Paragonimus heterotremus TaxID=100268 RepID=A0A8J4WDH3_9TREM|nr:Cell cycle checkpoint protein RAD1 [Paragonimus heterotremus]